MEPHQLIEHFQEMQSCTYHQLANQFVEYYYKTVDSSQLGINDVGHYAYYPKDTPLHGKALKVVR